MLISVIIPCYNVENYIKECLDSVYSQSYPQIEVIAVNNRSTDRTADILASYQQDSQSGLIILNEDKKGASAARNRGMNYSSGQWHQFLDADDLILPQKLTHQIMLLHSSPVRNPGLIAGSYKQLDAAGEIKSTVFPKGNRYIAPIVNEMGNTCANLWNRRWLEEVGGWNETLASSQDSELTFRLMLAGSDVIQDSAPLCLVRERASGQISQGSSRQRWQRYIEVRLTYIKQLKKVHGDVYIQYQQQLKTHLVSSLMILSNYDPDLSAQYYHDMFGKTRFVYAGYGIRWFHSLVIVLFGFKQAVNLRNRILRSGRMKVRNRKKREKFYTKFSDLSSRR